MATRPLEPGEAMRIMTGAPIPSGADAIIKVELTRPNGFEVLVLDEVHLVLVARHLVGNLGEDGRFTLERAERVLIEWRLQQQPRRLLLWLAAARPHRL